MYALNRPELDYEGFEGDSRPSSMTQGRIRGLKARLQGWIVKA